MSVDKRLAIKIVANSGRHISCRTAVHDEAHVLLELVQLLAKKIETRIRANCRCPKSGSGKSGLDSLLSIMEKEARSSGDQSADLKHLVLALLRSKHKVVTEVIKDLGLNQQALYRAVKKLLDSTVGD